MNAMRAARAISSFRAREEHDNNTTHKKNSIHINIQNAHTTFIDSVAARASPSSPSCVLRVQQMAFGDKQIYGAVGFGFSLIVCSKLIRWRVAEIETE